MVTDDLLRGWRQQARERAGAPSADVCPGNARLPAEADAVGRVTSWEAHQRAAGTRAHAVRFRSTPRDSSIRLPLLQAPMPRRRPALPSTTGTSLPWEQAARDFAAVLARVREGETVLLADGDRVVAQLAPPPRARALRPRPVFGALRGAGTLPDTFFDPLPEDELRAWEGGPTNPAARAGGRTDEHT